MPAPENDSTPTNGPAPEYIYGRGISNLVDHLNGLDDTTAFMVGSEILNQILHPEHGALEKIADLLEAASERVRDSPSDDGWDLSADLQHAAEQTRDLVSSLHDDRLVTRTRSLRAAPASRPGHAPAVVPRPPIAPQRRSC
ncbi:hypothetical protein [Streptomyces sp. NPDC058861]|uniref:hypothetical protein n=1 Tax=Streptomyces sp. NPDC058861 TaxID=3346653 RepID=UPI0036D153B6